MRQFLLIALMSLFIMSCNSGSNVNNDGKTDTIVAKPFAPTTNMVQVVYDVSGKTENIKDGNRVFPKEGTEVIVCDYYSLNKDSSVISTTYLWGLLPPSGAIPMNIDSDSLVVEFWKAKVLKSSVVGN